MSDLYTEKAQQVLLQAKKASKELKQNYVGTEHLLLGMIREGSGVAYGVLTEAGIEESQLLELIDQLISAPGVAVADRDGYSPKAEAVLSGALREASRFDKNLIGTEHLLIALIKEGDCVAARLLNTIGVNFQKLYVETLIAMGENPNRYKEDFKNGRPISEAEGSLTPTLDQYSRDLTKLAQEGKLDPVVGRETQISRVVQILSRRTKNNPCLIGEPGVGKTAIAEGLALRIAKGEVPATVEGKRVVTLDLSGMVAGSKYRGEFEERIKKVIREVIQAGNVLLFMDEVHTLIGAGGAEGSIDASNILKPSLARGEVQLIGATTIAEYRKYIEKDAALERRFQPVNVEEPTQEEAVEILQGIKEKYEEHHGVSISDEAVRACVTLTQRYINDRFLPDKAIDVMDEAAARLKLTGFKKPEQIGRLAEEIKELELAKEGAVVQENFQEASELQKKQKKLKKKLEGLESKYQLQKMENKPVLQEKDIAAVVAAWTRIPVEKLTEKENVRLLKLEETLHKRVIGQEEAVTAVAKAVKRGRVGLKAPGRPIGSFLFLGPTGVGKTELSKALAQALFGNEEALIRVDMSEFMESHSVSKMIGSPPGYVGFDEGGQLAEKVRRNPYSIVLFDEIEKAHPDVFNVLLQVLDDGHITDSKGRKVSFKNTVIIMTSNAGAQRIIDPKKLGFVSDSSEKKEHEDMKRGVMEEVKRIFKPEFLNRIDETIVFHALTEEELDRIVILMCRELSKRCQEQMGIKLSVNAAARKYICEKGNDKKYGARPLRRAVQTMIEDVLAEEILSGRVENGQTVTVGRGKDGLTFKSK